MYNPTSESFTPTNLKTSNKSNSKNGQKWTVVGDLNQFLANSNGLSDSDCDFVDPASCNHAGNNCNGDLLTSESSHYREAGIIEKLLPSYGFIQCCEREARLFFHYSQFNGKIEHLHIGDAVEFEMTYDKRAGKPIASIVVKISSEAIGEESALERVTGFITIELSAEKEGRVAYENRGECFFLPFGKEDLDDPSVPLRSKDRVNFLITKDKNGTPRARHIALETPSPQRYRGIVCTIKDSFGFIERVDQVREIFFHISECEQFNSLKVGQSVEFTIQVRNNKEVATSIVILSANEAVQFEQIKFEDCVGQILEPIDHSKLHPQLLSSHNSYSLLKANGYKPFPGRILGRKDKREISVKLGYREVKYTLQMGDWVRFSVVYDVRDNEHYAKNIVFMEESLDYSGEKRLEGKIHFDDPAMVEDAQGNLYLCPSTELISSNQSVPFTNSCTFTPSESAKGSKPMATRIILCDDFCSKPVDTLANKYKDVKGVITLLDDNARVGLIRLFKQDYYGCPEFIKFSFDEVTANDLPFVNNHVNFELTQSYSNEWNAKSIQIMRKESKADSTTFGGICLMSRQNGVLRSIEHDDNDIFFKVSQLPSNYFSPSELLMFDVDDEEGNYHAYNIRMLDPSNEFRQPFNENNYSIDLNLLGSNQKMAPMHRISRDKGCFLVDNSLVFFDVSDFVLLRLRLMNQFTFDIANELEDNRLKAINIRPSFFEYPDFFENTLQGTICWLKQDRSLGIIASNHKTETIFYPFRFESLSAKLQFLCFNVKIGDKVEFRRLNSKISPFIPSAIDVCHLEDKIQKDEKSKSFRLSNPNNLRGLTNSRPAQNGSSGSWQQGFVAALKDSYGFIEDYKQEIFFHFSVFNGNPDDLTLLQEVEYLPQIKNGKTSAESVRLLKKGTIAMKLGEQTLTGIVHRTIRYLNPDQEEYCGLIYECDASQDFDEPSQVPRLGNPYKFTMISLKSLTDCVYEDDPVHFQLATLADESVVAVNVTPQRKRHVGKISKLSDGYGHVGLRPLSVSSFSKKRLQFYFSEMKEKHEKLEVGDNVEFEIVRKKDRHMAIVVKLKKEIEQRPDHLIQMSKMQINDDFKSILLRQPKGPETGKGFVRTQSSEPEAN